jgi:hypothetical protein
MSRKLWRLLLEIKEEPAAPLTPVECFMLLEWLAEVLAETGEIDDGWLSISKYCHACVPNCRVELQQMLDELITNYYD